MHARESIARLSGPSTVLLGGPPIVAVDREHRCSADRTPRGVLSLLAATLATLRPARSRHVTPETPDPPTRSPAQPACRRRFRARHRSRLGRTARPRTVPIACLCHEAVDQPPHRGSEPKTEYSASCTTRLASTDTPVTDRGPARPRGWIRSMLSVRADRSSQSQAHRKITKKERLQWTRHHRPS